MSSTSQSIRAPAVAARTFPGGSGANEPLLHDAEAGTSSTISLSKPGGRLARLAQEDAEAARGRTRWKLVLYALAALACGVLTFNFHYIVQVSHIHVSTAHSHKTSAYCAFVGCKNDKSQAEAATPKAAPEVVAAMVTRVCGQPAIDGYAHVVPKCLEESPTAKWWFDYYKKGGNQSDLVVHIEQQADYDGLAVFWGIGNKKANIQECAAHCLRHMPNKVGGPFEHLPCNAFAFCPFDKCFEPDAHTHTKGDCWLKFTEGPASPEVNMRGVLPQSFRQRHPASPNVTQWISGVLLPPGVELTNGTWGPRWSW